MHEKIAEKHIWGIPTPEPPNDYTKDGEPLCFMGDAEDAINEAIEAQQEIVTTIEARQKASGEREQVHQKRIGELEAGIAELYTGLVVKEDMAVGETKFCCREAIEEMKKLGIAPEQPTPPTEHRPDKCATRLFVFAGQKLSNDQPMVLSEIRGFILPAITKATKELQARIEKCEKLLDTYLHYCCDVGGQEPDTGEIIPPTDGQWTELFGTTKDLLHPDPTSPSKSGGEGMMEHCEDWSERADLLESANTKLRERVEKLTNALIGLHKTTTLAVNTMGGDEWSVAYRHCANHILKEIESHVDLIIPIETQPCSEGEQDYDMEPEPSDVRFDLGCDRKNRPAKQDGSTNTEDDRRVPE